MKAIMISIKPKWVAKILNGEKTIEIRKTKPKCDLPIDVYIYCTKDKKSGLHYSKEYGAFNDLVGGMEHYSTIGDGCGKVVAKFTLNKIRTSDMTNCLQGSCLSYDEVNEYTKGKKFYGWHIDNLVIFDEPKELRQYHLVNDKLGVKLMGLTKAPQNYCYVEVE